MVIVNAHGMIELERKLIREKTHYHVFCKMTETGVIVKYKHFLSHTALGFKSRVYHDLTKGLDKSYNVIVEYCEPDKKRCWHMIIPTQIPDELTKAIEDEYGQRVTVDCCTKIKNTD